LFDLLPPGTYEVTVTAKGFRALHETGIIITAGFTATVNAMCDLAVLRRDIVSPFSRVAET
jgi:hypothetical protein